MAKRLLLNELSSVSGKDQSKGVKMVKRQGLVKNAVQAKRPCASDALSFDELPFVQSAVESSQIVEYSCFTPLPRDDDCSLDFRFDKNDNYLDLNRTWLNVQVQILNRDGSELEIGDATGFINNIGYSLFQSVDLYISDQQVTHSESAYPWWTYVYNLLYYTPAATNAYLTPGNCWYRDDPGEFEVFTTENFTNSGLINRLSRCGHSKKLWLSTRVLLNTNVSRLLPPQTEAMLKFNRSPTNLCLLSDSDKSYTIRIHDARIQATVSKMHDFAARQYEHMLATKGFFYPGCNPHVRVRTVGQGEQNFDWVVFNGKLPTRIYLFQIVQGAYNGLLDTNPFNFQPFDIQKIQVYKNGRALPGGQGITDFGTGSDYLKFYLSTVSAINNPEAFDIDQLQYILGYFIVCVDLTSDFSAGCDYNDESEYGSLRLAVDYKRPLADTITFFCLGEIEEVLRIDGNRNPTIE